MFNGNNPFSDPIRKDLVSFKTLEYGDDGNYLLGAMVLDNIIIRNI